MRSNDVSLLELNHASESLSQEQTPINLGSSTKSSTHVAVGAVFGVGFYREYAAAHARRAGQKAERPGLPREDRSRRRLVRRSHVLTILAAWLITVPLSAALSAGIYALMHVFSV